MARTSAMKKDDDHPLAIPRFLQRTKENELKFPNEKKGEKVKASAPSLRVVDETDNVLASLDPKIKDHLIKEIASHRFRRHWLLEGGVVELVQQEFKAKEEAAAASLEKRKARWAELKAEKEEAKKNAPPKPVFGQNAVVKILAKENPRKPGTGSHARFAEMAEFVKKNPGVTAAAIFAGTKYRKDDFEWDLARKAIATDVKGSSPHDVLKQVVNKAIAASSPVITEQKSHEVTVKVVKKPSSKKEELVVTETRKTAKKKPAAKKSKSKKSKK